MTTFIALLRSVNVGGNNKLPMASLQALCEKIGLQDVCTYIQSGNVVFRSPNAKLPATLQHEIEKVFHIRTPVILRTAEQLKAAVNNNPFPNVDPRKLIVSFLETEPAEVDIAAVRQMQISPEEVRIIGTEMFIHFPDGQGKSKLPMARMERTLKTTSTGRNWNTVQALLKLANG